MSYQKFYSNQIHSSSLLCQLSHLWKSQLLCDALIRAGSITIKAHRLVLIAACPMLQSMENASAGSHLEVRLAADIKQDSVNTFLQYLYEGFMMLTEENVRDVEKVARLLQVDGVIKCCADFYKSLKVKTGVAIQPGHNYKYSFQDLVEFRHVRASDIIKSTQDRITKRASEFSRPGSPGGKRQRMYMHPGSPSVERADDHHSMSDSYKTSHMTPDPWERVPRLGSGMGRHGATGRSNSQPGVIEIVEDSLEIVQTEPVNKDPNKPSDTRQTVQKSVAISIASQITDNTDLRVVNITGSNRDGGNTSTTSSAKSSSHSQQDSFPPKSNVSSSPLTSLQQSFSSSAMHRMPDMPSHMMPGPSFRQERAPELFQIPNFSSSDLELVQVSKPSKPPDSSANTSSSQSQRQPFPVSLSPVGASSKPSFAIGSASQSPSSQTMGSPMAMPTSTPIQPAHTVRSQSQSSTGTSEGVERASPVVDSGKDPSSYKEKQEPSPSSTAEMTPDISIVKVEGQDKDDTGGLDMYVDMPPDGTMTMHSGTGEESDNDHDEALEEWAREESVNESGDMSQMDPGGAKEMYGWSTSDDNSLDSMVTNLCRQPFPDAQTDPTTQDSRNALPNRPRPGLVDIKVAEAFQMVELVPGSGVYLYHDQMVDALKTGVETDQSLERSGEKMARYLLGVFYTTRQLVGTTMSRGTSPKRLLNPVITESIIESSVLEEYIRLQAANVDLFKGPTVASSNYSAMASPAPGIYTMEYASKFDMVEVSPGTRVFVYPHHLQVALKKGVEQGRDQSNGEKMARYLLGVFWTSKELLGKSLSGVFTTKEQLNPDIIAAITSFCVCNSRHRRGEVRMALASKVSSVCSKAKSAQRYIQQQAESRQQAPTGRIQNDGQSGPEVGQSVMEIQDNQYNMPYTERSYSLAYNMQTSNPYNPNYDLQDQGDQYK